MKISVLHNADMHDPSITLVSIQIEEGGRRLEVVRKEIGSGRTVSDEVKDAVDEFLQQKPLAVGDTWKNKQGETRCLLGLATVPL